MKKTSKAFREEVMTQVTTLTSVQALALHGEAGVQLVDIHDLQEFEREGLVPRPHHVPHGWLEFWVEAEEPFPAPVSGDTEEYVLFCGSDWRSAPHTQTLVEMRLVQPAAPMR